MSDASPRVGRPDSRDSRAHSVGGTARKKVALIHVRHALTAVTDTISADVHVSTIVRDCYMPCDSHYTRAVALVHMVKTIIPTWLAAQSHRTTMKNCHL